MISILATALSIIGNVGVVYKKIWGLVVWCISNFLWIYVGLKIHKDIPFTLLSCFYLCINSFTIFVWRKDARIQKS